MRSISLPTRTFSALAVVVLAAACSNPNALPIAQFTNVVDTTTLYALTGTSIGLPSGYDGVAGVAARTDLNIGFDFAIDIDTTGQLVLYPIGVLGLTKDAGILMQSLEFDAVSSAPLDGYVQDSTVVAAPGSVFVLKSRVSTSLCTAGALPRYGKFHVLGVDAQARSATFEVLMDLNCGYRDLVPGIPEH
jgi:hypothetical protein